MSYDLEAINTLFAQIAESMHRNPARAMRLLGQAKVKIREALERAALAAQLYKGPWCCERAEAQGVPVCEECAEASAGYSAAMRSEVTLAAHPAASGAGAVLEWRPFALTLATALDRGDDPALLMDENSPLRDELRRLLASESALAAHKPDGGDVERIRNPGATLDCLTSDLSSDHPLRLEAAKGAKQAVADLYRIAEQLDAAISAQQIQEGK